MSYYSFCREKCPRVKATNSKQSRSSHIPPQCTCGRRVPSTSARCRSHPVSPRRSPCTCTPRAELLLISILCCELSNFPASETVPRKCRGWGTYSPRTSRPPPPATSKQVSRSLCFGYVRWPCTSPSVVCVIFLSEAGSSPGFSGNATRISQDLSQNLGFSRVRIWRSFRLTYVERRRVGTSLFTHLLTIASRYVNSGAPWMFYVCCLSVPRRVSCLFFMKWHSDTRMANKNWQ